MLEQPDWIWLYRVSRVTREGSPGGAGSITTEFDQGALVVRKSWGSSHPETARVDVKVLRRPQGNPLAPLEETSLEAPEDWLAAPPTPLRLLLWGAGDIAAAWAFLDLVLLST